MGHGDVGFWSDEGHGAQQRYRDGMSSIVLLIFMWWAGVLAAIRVTFHRLLVGPTVPTWTWRTEWFVAIARSTIAVAARDQDDVVVNLFGRLVRTSVPVSLRHEIHVRRTKLAGIPTDRFMRLADPADTATMLYFHGGGYVFGNPGTHRQFIAHLAHATHVSVFAPQYRLAPRHSFPAAVNDAISAYEGLLASGTRPETIIVAGDSAGGGLAMAVVHRARSKGLPLPGGIMVFSPYVDLTHSGYTIELNAGTDYLPLSELSGRNDSYAPGYHLENPEVSPLFADMAGYPPLLIFAGGREMLLDDSVRLDARARAAGVDSKLCIEDDMMHVWPVALTWEPATPRTFEICASWVAATVVETETENREP
jgi:monoterpene epsilon-lactone hydrolase